MSNPGRVHWQALKWILRYLKGTRGTTLQYVAKDDSSSMIEEYVDSDYAGCLDSRKSLSGYIFKCYGEIISWKASLHRVVALSSTEVKYMAATEAIEEGIWLHGFIWELGVDQENLIAKRDDQSPHEKLGTS